MEFKDDIDDLLGVSTTAQKRAKAVEKAMKHKAKKQGKTYVPPSPKRVLTAAPDQVAAEDQTPEMLRYTMPQTIGDLHDGVSLSFLAQLFGMTRHMVVKRLRGCEPLRRVRNSPVYDLRDAAQYLVEPKIDIEELLKTLKPDALPVRLQKDFWDAQLKRLKWRKEAGELWGTDQVRKVFGEVFKHIKTSIQLWADEVERLHGLTTDQRGVLTLSADALQDDIYKALMVWAEQDDAGNLADVEDLDGEADGAI